MPGPGYDFDVPPSVLIQPPVIVIVPHCVFEALPVPMPAPSPLDFAVIVPLVIVIFPHTDDLVP